MRFYVRQGTERRIEGPYSTAGLRARLASRAVSSEAEAVEARGQTLSQLQATPDWRNAAQLADAYAALEPAATVPASKAAEADQPADPRVARMRLLIGAGVLLVCLAPFFGELLAPKTTLGGLTAWSTDTANQITITARLLGIMAFVAGLVERVLLAVSENRHGR